MEKTSERIIIFKTFSDNDVPISHKSYFLELFTKKLRDTIALNNHKKQMADYNYELFKK